MQAQLYVVEQPDKSFYVYDKNNDTIPVHIAPNLYSAVDYCYHAGLNFEVEIMEQIELQFEGAQAE
jgi:hypothetical protein